MPTWVSSSAGTRSGRRRRRWVSVMKKPLEGIRYGDWRQRWGVEVEVHIEAVTRSLTLSAHPHGKQEELERLNKRRAEREVERELREEEEARMARMAESAQMAEWVAKE